MRTFILTCCLLITATAAYLPRSRRDVSELQPPAYNYLPPEPKLALPIELEPETTTVEEALIEIPTPAPASAALTPNGYEYRTVRRLKFRTRRLRRDVSHLAAHYLPPQNDYLPPAAAAPAPTPEEADTEEVVAAPAPKVANEYLPPNEESANAEVPAEVTEAPLPEVRDNELVEIETEPAPVAEEEEAPQDTAVLADDGYHYKQPNEVPELKAAPSDAAAAAPAPAEYLPPANDDTVAVEGPAESAVLAADGYHYRAVKRLRF